MERMKKGASSAMHMRRMTLALPLLVFVLASLCLSGCSRSDAGPPSATGTLQTVIETAPSPPHAGQDVKFTVRVTEGSQPLAKAQVSLFLEMSDMDHGENRVALQEQLPGVYAGTGRFSMAGAWLVHVRAEQNGRTETANVKLAVQP
jgi:hypothetical protein